MRPRVKQRIASGARRLRLSFAYWLLGLLWDLKLHHEADFIIGPPDRPYLMRWWLIPRNRFFNLYLHLILRSDDDRALHDHPWWSLGYMLSGRYIEHTIGEGGVHHTRWVHAGDLRLRSGRFAHRLEMVKGERAWTLFITGPLFREWGFHCTKGWVPARLFVASENPGQVGHGCEAPTRRPRRFWQVWTVDNT